MADQTKACSLTKNEIMELIRHHGYSMNNNYDIDFRMERLSYLHKRLKAFDELEIKNNASSIADETKPTAQGWGAPSNG